MLPKHALYQLSYAENTLQAAEDSNPDRTGLEPGILPLEQQLANHSLVRPERFELSTCRVEAGCSVH